jgi:hypothetical protein
VLAKIPALLVIFNEPVEMLIFPPRPTARVPRLATIPLYFQLASFLRLQ